MATHCSLHLGFDSVTHALPETKNERQCAEAHESVGEVVMILARMVSGEDDQVRL